MSFQSKVIRRELYGIDRKLHAAGRSLKSAQWAVDRAEIAVRDQAVNLKTAEDVLVKVQANYDAFLAEKAFEDQKT